MCQPAPGGIMVIITGFEWTCPEQHVVLLVIWLIAAAALGVAEMLTTTLALGLVAVGALAAALTETVGGPPLLQLAVFVAVSLAGIVLIRPLALRRPQRRTTRPTRAGAPGRQTRVAPPRV